MTPEYLKQIGLLDSLPSAASDTATLLRTALDKIAFLPFALAVDHWRWGVFAGDITPERYNAAWWDLKHRYQGIVEPVARSERDFDPGAKYHVAVNAPYIVYFIARVLQFQFHRSWCRAAGWTGRRGGPSARHDARDGGESAMAGDAVSGDRRATDGCDGDGRLFPAVARLARAAEPEPAGGMVRSSRPYVPISATTRLA